MTFDEKYKLKQKIRALRAKRCFPIINRGKLWYERLTNVQQGELREWYQKWLDATETFITPADLPWFNEKLLDDEDV